MFKKLTVMLGIFLILVSGIAAAEESSCLKLNASGNFYSLSAEEDVIMASTLPTLATPKNLKWNVDANGEKFNGSLAWDTVPNCEGIYNVWVYRNGQEVFSTNWYDLYDHNGSGKISIDVVDCDVFNQSGTYTFAVQAIGDGINYDSSNIATSGEYHFTCPSLQLSAPKNPVWLNNDGMLQHSSVENAGGYSYSFYNQDKESIGGTWHVENFPLNSPEPTVISDFSWYLKEMSNWNYNLKGFYFKVTALTYDIEKYQNSVSSDFSDFFEISLLEENDAGLEDILSGVDNGELTATEAKDIFLDNLQMDEISNTDLALSMQQNQNLVDSISQLETLYCEENNTEVTVANKEEDASYLNDRGIDANAISVIGAALNSQDGKDVDISFSKADDELSQDSLFYKNSVAVNIDIDGVNDSKNLDIPIQITMPAPAGVLPERMVILHYHADGSIETIHPRVFYQEDVSYLSFVLTSFSPFVFCNEIPRFTYDSLSNQVSVTSETAVENGTLAVCAYKDGVLINFESVSANIEANMTTPVQLEHFDAFDADEIRYFVWNNLLEMVPLLQSDIESL